MAGISIDLQVDVRRAVAELKRRGMAVADVVAPEFARGGFLVEAAMKEYPPPPPASSYRRTGLLGRAWASRTLRRAAALTTEVANPTRYAPLVQSRERQARVHQGRWTTDEQALDMHARDIVDGVSRALRSLAR